MQIPTITRFTNPIRSIFQYKPVNRSLFTKYSKSNFDFSMGEIERKIQEQMQTGIQPSLRMRKIQRGADLIISSVLAVPLLAVSGFCGLMQKISNHKIPVFFTEIRAGLHGVPVKVCKVPTIESGENNIALTSPFSRFLRRRSIDEFPQIINVLKGEMSLFGPRIILRNEIPKAANMAGIDFLERYNFKPGFGFGTLAEKESPVIRRGIEKNVFRNFTLTEYFKTIYKLSKNVLLGRNK